VSQNRKPVIGVMGGADVSSTVLDMAFELGALIAEENWVLLNGGRDAGVMRASAAGANSKNGLVIGILPGDSAEQANHHIDIAIVTNMGDARNVINVLSSDVVVVCPGGTGTISEAALALKSNKPVVLFADDDINIFQKYEKSDFLVKAATAADCIKEIKLLLAK
jgi:uncharacterized protein (TIGR00725 family)